MNIALYLLFTVFCFYIARPPLRLACAVNPRLANSPFAERRLPRFVRRILSVRRMNREQTVAVCFCGAAKTTSLGIPLSTAMWRDAPNLTRAYIQIPILLYTIEQVYTLPISPLGNAILFEWKSSTTECVADVFVQVFLAQILVYFFRWYLEKGAAADSEALIDRTGEPSPGVEAGEERDVHRTSVQVDSLERARDDHS